MEIKTNNFIHFGISKQHKNTLYPQKKEFGIIIPNNIILGKIINEYDTQKNRTIINRRIQKFHPFKNDTTDRIRTIIKDAYKGDKSYGPNETGDGLFWVFKQILVKGERLNITANQYKRYCAIKHRTPENGALIYRVEHVLKSVGLNHLIRTIK